MPVELTRLKLQKPFQWPSELHHTKGTGTKQRRHKPSTKSLIRGSKFIFAGYDLGLVNVVPWKKRKKIKKNNTGKAWRLAELRGKERGERVIRNEN